MNETVALLIKTFQTGVGPQPQRALPVDQQGANIIPDQAVGVIRLGLKMGECSGEGVVTVKPARLGCDPDPTGRVFSQVKNPTVIQTFG